MKSELKYTTKPPWYGVYNTGAKAIKNTLIQSFTSGNPDTPEYNFRYVIPWTVKIGDNEFKVSIKNDVIQFYLVNINEKDNYEYLYSFYKHDDTTDDTKFMYTVKPENANLKIELNLQILYRVNLNSCNIYLKNTGELVFLRYETSENIHEIIITDDGYIQYHKLINVEKNLYSRDLYITHCKITDPIQTDTQTCHRCSNVNCINYNEDLTNFNCEECVYNDICYNNVNDKCSAYKNKYCEFNNKFCVNCSYDFCSNNKTEGTYSDTCLKNVKQLQHLNNLLFKNDEDIGNITYFLLKPKYYTLNESERNDYNIYQFDIDTEQYISNVGFEKCKEELFVIDKKNNNNVITTIPLIVNTNDVSADELLLGVNVSNSHKYIKLKEATNIEDTIYHTGKNKLLNVKHDNKVYSNFYKREFTTNVHNLSGWREHIPEIRDSNTIWTDVSCYYIESRRIRYIHGCVSFSKGDDVEYLPDGNICKSFRIYYDNKDISQSIRYTSGSVHYWDSGNILTDHPQTVIFTIDVAKNNGLNIDNFDINDLDPIRRIAWTVINKSYTDKPVNISLDFLVLEDAEPSNDSYIYLK